MKVRGVRGATTVPADTSENIFEATKELMEEVVRLNDIDVDDVASVLLTMTPDLSAAFPAKAVRSLPGWQWVPLMCAREIGVPGALARSIRILIHLNTDKRQDELVHAYLGEAVQLRPDLATD
ncbi:chorismate mutase [Alicyclobacillus dauci]|uniref:chorismate mutase n=1 Tax=Alicyclobacillus dauci TaxID=1475485 RepID=A0ABY6YXJ6_9BACL|nr:chorismate mutase [Alicyclobacillus dauci]WAH35124.1 chorismate mutase [Alicyclobacillus dauci]